MCLWPLGWCDQAGSPGQARAPSGVYEVLGSAAEFVARTLVRDGMVVGLGAGPGAQLVTQQLALRLKDPDDGLASLSCVAASADAGACAARLGLPLNTEAGVAPDILFIEADLLQPDPLGMVKGRWVKNAKAGAWDALAQEKELAARAGQVVALVHERDVAPLSGAVPVEVDPACWEEAYEELDDLFVGDAEIWRRAAEGGLLMNDGGEAPYVTPRGNYILDVIFEARDGSDARLPCHDVDAAVASIEATQGVVAHGLWTRRAVDLVAVAGEQGISMCPLEEADGGEQNVRESYAGWTQGGQSDGEGQDEESDVVDADVQANRAERRGDAP